MLPGLLNIAHTNDQWSWFSWNHRLSHDRIRQGIKDKLGLNLTDYSVDPMDPHAMDQFLQNNAQLHTDMNAALGLPGIDLFDIDLSKENQKSAWFWFHFIEHQTAENKLQVGS